MTDIAMVKNLRKSLRMCFDIAVYGGPYYKALSDKVVSVARQFGCDVSLNIDVYDIDAMYVRFSAFCNRYDECVKCPIHKKRGTHADCYNAWLFMSPELERKRRKDNA